MFMYMCVYCVYMHVFPVLCVFHPIHSHRKHHQNDVIMGAIASQITSLPILYSIVYSDAGQRKYQSSASLAFVRGIHRWPVNSPHKWPVTRKTFPFDDVIMIPIDVRCRVRPFAKPPSHHYYHHHKSHRLVFIVCIIYGTECSFIYYPILS